MPLLLTPAAGPPDLQDRLAGLRRRWRRAVAVRGVCVVAVLSGLLWAIAALSVFLFVRRDHPRLLLRAVFFGLSPSSQSAGSSLPSSS